MTISIAIHVDGYYGLVNGVPNLLDLFDKYEIKATFFVNMGREANIFQILKYRNSGKTTKSDNISSRYTTFQLLEMALLNRGLGHKHPEILKEIKERGHEINPHCWSHLLWSKNFDDLNKENQILRTKNSFYKIFKNNPSGFCPPTWKFDDNVLKILKKEGFDYLAIKGPETKISRKSGLKLIPLSYSKNIEELFMEGKKEKDILKIYKKQFDKKYVNLYFHSDFEGIDGIDIFEKVLKLIKDKKMTLYKDL